MQRPLARGAAPAARQPTRGRTAAARAPLRGFRSLHARAHSPYSTIEQNSTNDDAMMVHCCTQGGTMTPNATAATHLHPMGPTAATAPHRYAQCARCSPRQAGDSTETVK